jgi:hypothetical protein
VNPMRREKRPAKLYPLTDLLSRQPKSLQKHEGYLELLSLYRASPRLRSLRISRRCYRLLDGARIAPEHLDNFYRTYRLPKNPFFPLFFSLKGAYLARRSELRRLREAWIHERFRELQPRLLRFITLLGKNERALNLAGRTPVWERVIYPKTKKQAREYLHYTTPQWAELFDHFGRELKLRYPAAPARKWDRLFAAFLLECIPQKEPFEEPDPQTVRRQYRRLSKLHHPDSGGDADFFLRLKEARDFLLDS